jgi:anoctamin-10
MVRNPTSCLDHPRRPSSKDSNPHLLVIARAEAEASYVQLVQALTNIGLTTEVRACDAESLLVFVKVASDKLLSDQVFRSRLQDWLHGVRTAGAGKDVASSLRDEPVSEAERLRLLYLMITKPKNDGGAGITVGAKAGPWRFVDSIFPLHDHEFNKRWIKKWSTKYLLEQEDLDEIRGRFGERVAFYFAFTQSYFRFLVFPAAFGFAAWLLLGQFSFLYALMMGLWSVVFFEYWKQKEVDLAVQWGVRGASAIQQPRPEFEFEHEAEDTVTGEPVKVYSPWKRLQTQLLQFPFAVACAFVLGGFITLCNSLEIFINEVYSGPGMSFLVRITHGSIFYPIVEKLTEVQPFLPTVLLVTILPTFSTLLTGFAETLNRMENYETMDGISQLSSAASLTALPVLT